MAANLPSIPLSAKAAVLPDVKQAYVVKDDHPVKQPSELAPGQCLIKLEYAGVCHSDLQVQQGSWGRKPNVPLVGGHEGVGHIVAIGEHSGVGPVNIGDRVGVKWIGEVCMKCEMCRKGHESSCLLSFQRSHGFMLHGTFAQYVVSYLNYVTPIPHGLDSAAATPILCAGLTVYKGLKQANVQIGDWIVISGAGGGLGHLAVQYAVAMGLRVIGIDTGEAKKQLCLKLGAEKWVDYRESTDVIEDVKAATDGLGPKAAIIAAGDPRPFNQALMYLGFTGTLVCLGAPGGNAMINVPIQLLIAKSLRIVGSAIGNRQDAIEALQIAAQGKVKCQYEVRELGDLNQVFAELEQGKVAGRIVLKL